ncbi:hypothetical protein M5K25_004026 [Dendrobium thyrsiflorum]|uniref:Uncharacterized protein n=1 Tax=Dendrobium thyrsiflorum TaxID=117978 RepID=A0ABD0VSC0_DENTH
MGSLSSRRDALEAVEEPFPRHLLIYQGSSSAPRRRGKSWSRTGTNSSGELRLSHEKNLAAASFLRASNFLLWSAIALIFVPIGCYVDASFFPLAVSLQFLFAAVFEEFLMIELPKIQRQLQLCVEIYDSKKLQLQSEFEREKENIRSKNLQASTSEQGLWRYATRALVSRGISFEGRMLWCII